MFGSISIESYVCQPPETPTITQPLEGAVVVGGQQFVISGTSSPDTVVTLSDNGTAFATVTADQYKNYALQTSVTPGSHAIGIDAQNPCGSAVGTSVSIEASAPVDPPEPPIIIIPDVPSVSTPPAPVITYRPPVEPTNNTLVLTEINLYSNLTTSAPSVLISGRTNQEATFEILVNDTVVATRLDPGLSFGFTVPLKLGSNTVVVKASTDTDSVQHTMKVTRIHSDGIIYSDGQTGLQQGNRVDETDNPAWYQTTPGKIVVGSTAIILIILIVVLLL